MTTRYIHSLNRSQPNMLSIACSETAGSGSRGRAAEAARTRPGPDSSPTPPAPETGPRHGRDGRVLREDGAPIAGLHA